MYTSDELLSSSCIAHVSIHITPSHKLVLNLLMGTSTRTTKQWIQSFKRVNACVSVPVEIVFIYTYTNPKGRVEENSCTIKSFNLIIQLNQRITKPTVTKVQRLNGGKPTSGCKVCGYFRSSFP